MNARNIIEGELVVIAIPQKSSMYQGQRHKKSPLERKARVIGPATKASTRVTVFDNYGKASPYPVTVGNRRILRSWVDETQKDFDAMMADQERRNGLYYKAMMEAGGQFLKDRLGVDVRGYYSHLSIESRDVPVFISALGGDPMEELGKYLATEEGQRLYGESLGHLAELPDFYMELQEMRKQGRNAK